MFYQELFRFFFFCIILLILFISTPRAPQSIIPKCAAAEMGTMTANGFRTLAIEGL